MSLIFEGGENVWSYTQEWKLSSDDFSISIYSVEDKDIFDGKKVYNWNLSIYLNEDHSLSQYLSNAEGDQLDLVMQYLPLKVERSCISVYKSDNFTFLISIDYTSLSEPTSSRYEVSLSSPFVRSLFSDAIELGFILENNFS